MPDTLIVKGNVFATTAISKESLFAAMMSTFKIKSDFRTGFYSYPNN